MRLTGIILALFLLFPVHAKAKDAGKPLVPRYNRVISLKPNITLILQSLGLSEKIVGVTKYCPKTNDSAVVVGDYNSIDVETIVRLKPDLILTSTENSQSRQFEALQAAGLHIKLYTFQNYDELVRSIAEIAGLVDSSTQGLIVVNNMNEKISRISEQNKIKNQIPKSFVVMVQRRPLMVAAGNTFISSLLTKAGFNNVHQANQIAYPVLEDEDLVYASFDYLFDLSHADKDQDVTFLNRTVIFLPTGEFLAAPQSVDNLEKLIQMSLRGP